MRVGVGWPLCAVVACGCGAGYQMRSFESVGGPFPGARRSLGCVDIGVVSRHMPEATGPVVELTFANGCDAATPLDLSAIVATAYDADGPTTQLTLRDPKGTIAPAWLEARVVASETLEFHPPSSPLAMTLLCLDLGRVTPTDEFADGEEVCVKP